MILSIYNDSPPILPEAQMNAFDISVSDMFRRNNLLVANTN